MEALKPMQLNMPGTGILVGQKSRWILAIRGRALLLVALSFFAAGKLSAQTSNRTDSADSLHQFSGSVEDLVRRVSPSVVEVKASGVGPVENDSRENTDVRIARWRSIGSGVIVDPDGYVVTNAHVVSGAQHIEVVLTSASADGSPPRSLSMKSRTAIANLVGISEEIDLAVLKIEAP